MYHRPTRRRAPAATTHHRGHAPVVRRTLIETRARPRVSRGAPFTKVRRVPAAVAWERYEELQLDSAAAQTALIPDVDRQPQACLHVAFGPHVCPPNRISTSPLGHSNVVYALARPVLQTAHDMDGLPIFLRFPLDARRADFLQDSDAIREAAEGSRHRGNRRSRRRVPVGFALQLATPR